MLNHIILFYVLLDVLCLHPYYKLQELRLNHVLLPVFFLVTIGVKGYKLLDLESKWVFLSRYLIFHETIFP